MVVPYVVSSSLAKATKVAFVTALTGWGTWLAQLELPNLGPAINIGGVGVIALLVGRYTMRQLESYRADLRDARERGDRLEIRIETAEAAERRWREYAYQLRLLMIQQGDEPPPPPNGRQ